MAGGAGARRAPALHRLSATSRRRQARSDEASTPRARSWSRAAARPRRCRCFALCLAAAQLPAQPALAHSGRARARCRGAFAALQRHGAGACHASNGRGRISRRCSPPARCRSARPATTPCSICSRAGRPAIVVPFDAGNETEQAVRARGDGAGRPRRLPAARGAEPGLRWPKRVRRASSRAGRLPCASTAMALPGLWRPSRRCWQRVA